MPTTPVNSQGLVSRVKPARVGDGAERVFRAGPYGEEFNLSLIQKSHLLAEEGSYFVSTNPTPGTGIAGQAAPTAAPTVAGGGDTKPFISIFNSAAPADGTRISLDYLRLRPTAAGANGTSINFMMQIDSAPRSPVGAGFGGTSIVPVNPNMDSGSKSLAIVNAGSLTALASGATARQLPNIQFRGVITVVNDIYIVSFGPAEYGVGSLISSGSGVCQQSFGHPPVVIGPQQTALIYLWMPAQTGASSFEFDMGHWER